MTQPTSPHYIPFFGLLDRIYRLYLNRRAHLATLTLNLRILPPVAFLLLDEATPDILPEGMACGDSETFRVIVATRSSIAVAVAATAATAAAAITATATVATVATVVANAAASVTAIFGWCEIKRVRYGWRIKG